ncbi:kinase-like domain-containing protein [Camillea tinctor]|nr:kinase-like domain-containing protein [Camillea tinctor]
MEEGEPVMMLGVTPDCIWGDRNKKTVYAQAFGQGRSMIFRFYLNRVNPPESLPIRVVSCYHGLPVLNEAHTFPDHVTMRTAIWSAVANVWHRCFNEPEILGPGTIIDITSSLTGAITWLALREPSFDKYLNLLRHIQPKDLAPGDSTLPTVDISHVDFLETMGRSGRCKRVETQEGQTGPVTYVFKGFDFHTYLQVRDGDDIRACCMIEDWRKSSNLIANMAPHPYIQQPPRMLVSVRDWHLQPVIIGHLSTFFTRRDLSEVITSANITGAPIPLRQKAKWCYQMSLAIAYAHRVAHTYHRDIHPGNFVVDAQQNLVLIDWEQRGTSASTLAPEADGTWDVVELPNDQLMYGKYTGAGRRNMPVGSGEESYNVWNVFPDWQSSCPRATELAEVFALGRTMWMLLAQVVVDGVKHPDDVQVVWGNEDEHIPAHWVAMVEKCMDRDPNMRPDVAHL